jgi:hypothetical protein
MPSQQSVDLSQPASVTLALGAWNTVLACIAKTHWETADPLMQELRRQIAVALQPTGPSNVVPLPEAG